jgi:NTE family protein
MTHTDAAPPDLPRLFADLVFEGGGVKGIGLVGALSALEERGYKPQSLAGASAGAVVATLLGAGYTATELRALIRDLDFRRFQDQDWEDRIPLLGAPLSILKDRGLYEGDAFLAYMQELLKAKGVHSFRDLELPEFAGDPNPVYHHKVQVIASDLTQRSLLVLPRDARRLGIEPAELGVALAVRMSMSIPVYFEPVWFLNPQSGRKHLIVDGGILSNFPVWLFDVPRDPAWPTFGLKLVEPEPMLQLGARLPDEPASSGPGAVVDFAKCLVQTMMEAHDRLYIEQAQFARTIAIPTLGVGTTEFDLSEERATALFEAGRTAASEFLATWDFDGYKAAFRSGQEHHRREDVVAEMAEAAQT